MILTLLVLALLVLSFYEGIRTGERLAIRGYSELEAAKAVFSDLADLCGKTLGLVRDLWLRIVRVMRHEDPDKPNRPH